MKKRATLCGVVALLLACQTAWGQSPTAPTVDPGKPGSIDQEIQKLQLQIAKLQIDLKDLKGVVLINQKLIMKHEKEIQDLDNQLKSNLLAITGILNTHSDVLAGISRKDNNGRYVLNLLGNMKASPEFKTEFRDALGQTGTAGRIMIQGPDSSDDYLYVNGVRWRFLRGTMHYVPVPFGTVYIQRNPNLPATPITVVRDGPEPMVHSIQIVR